MNETITRRKWRSLAQYEVKQVVTSLVTPQNPSPLDVEYETEEGAKDALFSFLLHTEFYNRYKVYQCLHINGAVKPMWIVVAHDGHGEAVEWAVQGFFLVIIGS
jgi:hypothetical protein